MQHDIPKLITAIIDRLPGKTTQTQLAQRLSNRRVKITQEQISRWKAGQEPKQKAYERLVEVAIEVGVISESVSSEDVAAGLPVDDGPRMVKLKGYVGASSEAHFYNVADQDLEEVPAPGGATDKTVAVEIRGSSLGKFFDTWLVYYNDVRSPITDDLYGELCVVGLSDDRILIKRVQPGRRGTFNLISNSETEAPIEGVQIEWAALVTDLKPRRAR